MTELDQKQIFDLLRQFFAPGQPVPLSQAQAVLKYRGVDCLALGYPTYHSLFADMPGYLELRQRANAPLFYDLVLLDSPAGVADQPQQAREPEQPAPAQQTDPSQQTAPDQQAQEGRCVLTEQQRSTLYRVLWEHYPLHFDIPLTDAAPLAAQFGFTPQQFFQGPGSPKTYHLFQALEPWARVEQGNSNVYYVTLEEAPEVLARTQSITGKRAGLTEEDRKKICRCLAKALPINTPILLNQLGQVLVDGNIDFRAMGFNRAPRLLPCLMEDLEQVMADPRQAGQPEVCIQLKPSILRYLQPGQEPQDQGLEQDRDKILDLLIRSFGPGTRRPMAAVFLVLNQHGLGSKKYGLKGMELLRRLGIPCQRVESATHPGNSDYLVTIPRSKHQAAPQPAAAEPKTPETAEPQAAANESKTPETPEPQAAANESKTPEAAEPQAAANESKTPEAAEPQAEAGASNIPAPPTQWQNQVFFHLKTQGILAEFLGLSALDSGILNQIAQDYAAALAADQVKWVPNKSCYSFPLSLRTPQGRETFLSIKVNDYPGGAPWRVNFVGYQRFEHPTHQIQERPDAQPHQIGAPEPRFSQPSVQSQPLAHPQPEPSGPPVAEASAAEITAPAFTRLSDRDKLEIYRTLLPLNPVGTPVLLSVASSTLAGHGITPQRYGYARMLQLVSDMPEYFRITSAQPRPDAPLTYSITLLPLPQAGAEPLFPVVDPANSDQPPFAMTERTIAFPTSQQGFLSRFINDPEGTEKLTEEQITEFQTSYDSAVSTGALVYDPAYQCYKFPLSLIARDGRALRATIKRSDRPVPPAWYVSFIEKCDDKGVRPGAKLKNFAYLGNIQDFLASLAAHAEGEKWGFGDNPEDYSILWNYISYTFYRLDYEGKVYIDPNGQFAAFNTGLLSRRFGEDLLAYFEPYSGPGGMRWKFVCFCSGTNEASGGAERKAVTLLAPLSLELPQYFSNLYDTMFDPSTKLESNFMHIVRDNLARFPLSWLHKQCDDHQRTRALLETIEEERSNFREVRKLFGDQSAEAAESRQRQKQLFRDLGAAITDENDDNMCDLLMDMKDLFEGAVGRTLDRCRRNFKLAVPCYFPTRNVMSMLLPISFSRAKNGAPCMALVAERQKNGIYLGRTVLTMRMAYNDARLLCRPSSEWLNTSGLPEENGLEDGLEESLED